MRCRLLHRARGDADHPAGIARPEVGEAEADEPDDGQQHELVGGLEAIVGDLGGRPRRRAAGVPDEHVDAAERLEGALDEPLEVRSVGHISTYGERAQAVRFTLELVASPGEHRHVGAFLGKRFRRGQAEPRSGSADDRRPAAQTEIHWGGTVARPGAVTTGPTWILSYVVRTATTSRTASADAPSAACSESSRSTSRICSIPFDPS